MFTQPPYRFRPLISATKTRFHRRPRHWTSKSSSFLSFPKELITKFWYFRNITASHWLTMHYRPLTPTSTYREISDLTATTPITPLPHDIHDIIIDWAPNNTSELGMSYQCMHMDEYGQFLSHTSIGLRHWVLGRVRAARTDSSAEWWLVSSAFGLYYGRVVLCYSVWDAEWDFCVVFGP